MSEEDFFKVDNKESLCTNIELVIEEPELQQKLANGKYS
jgi:hypothetical protein